MIDRLIESMFFGIEVFIKIGLFAVGVLITEAVLFIVLSVFKVTIEKITKKWWS